MTKRLAITLCDMTAGLLRNSHSVSTFSKYSVSGVRVSIVKTTIDNLQIDIIFPLGGSPDVWTWSKTWEKMAEARLFASVGQDARADALAVSASREGAWVHAFGAPW